MKIPNRIIPLAYRTAQSVYRKEITLKEGTSILTNSENLNSNSARDYINNFKYIIEGKSFSRTLNEESMEYYFKNITRDYGFEQLKISLSSLNQHISYYEGIQNTTMHKMRAIHSKYMNLTNLPRLVSQLSEIEENIITLEKGLTSVDENQRELYSNLIRKGICFVAYKVEDEWRFAPSRFVGYVKNMADKYDSLQLDGRETNKQINFILKTIVQQDELLKNEFENFCLKLNLQHNSAFNRELKFWKLTLDETFNDNNLMTGEFPEGKLVERSHKFRERNLRVIQIAKANFKRQHGKIFCQVCQFDFEEKYGELGKDFIEGHHTIAISEMSPGHITRPEDIAMLCSNCHKMVHKKRPWLSMEKLINLLQN